jgi:hypothetical protein
MVPYRRGVGNKPPAMQPEGTLGRLTDGKQSLVKGFGFG